MKLRKNRRKNENRDQEELEVGVFDALEKYSNNSPVYHIFKENLTPGVFEPMSIKFYFVETSAYHIAYCRFLSPE
jgi:hypothetical protein